MKKFLAVIVILAAVILAAAPLAMAERIDLSEYMLTELYGLRTQIDKEIQQRIADNQKHIGGHTGYFDLGDVSVALDGFKVQSISGKHYFILSVRWMNQSDEPTAYYVEANVDAYQDGVELDDGYISGVEKNNTRRVLPGYSTTVTEIYELRNTRNPIVIMIEPWVDFRNEYPPQQIVIDIK